MKLKNINEWHISEADEKSGTPAEVTELAKTIETMLQEDDDTIKVKVAMLKNNNTMTIVDGDSTKEKPYTLSSANLKAITKEFKTAGIEIKRFGVWGAGAAIYFQLD